MMPSPAGSDVLAIRQIEFQGHVGTTPAEREAGQRLSVDVELACDMKQAAESDRLSEALDYDGLARALVRIGENSRDCLMETLASRMAESITEDARVRWVHVRLTKCQPPYAAIRGGVSVEVCRMGRCGGK